MYIKKLNIRARENHILDQRILIKIKSFLIYFGATLLKKNYWDQMRRMKFFACGIKLIRKSTYKPISRENPNKSGEILHRFAGISVENELFFVQIKEEKSTNKKFLISIFPVEKWR